MRNHLPMLLVLAVALFVAAASPSKSIRHAFKRVALRIIAKGESKIRHRLVPQTAEYAKCHHACQSRDSLTKHQQSPGERVKPARRTLRCRDSSLAQVGSA